MAVPKLRVVDNKDAVSRAARERVETAQREDRAERGKFRRRGPQWERAAKQLARERSLDANRVLDDFDQQADVYEWSGESRAQAEQHAWLDVLEIYGCNGT